MYAVKRAGSQNQKLVKQAAVISKTSTKDSLNSHSLFNRTPHLREGDF